MYDSGVMGEGGFFDFSPQKYPQKCKVTGVHLGG